MTTGKIRRLAPNFHGALSALCDTIATPAGRAGSRPVGFLACGSADNKRVLPGWMIGVEEMLKLLERFLFRGEGALAPARVAVVLLAVMIAVAGAFSEAGAQTGRGVILSTDPLVFGPPGPVRPDPRVVESIRPVWQGIRVGEPEEKCDPFVPEEYGVDLSGESGSTRAVPRLTPIGAIEGRSPLSCTLVDLRGSRGRFVTVEEAHRRGLCRLPAALRRYYVIDHAAVMPGLFLRSVLEHRARFGPGWLPNTNRCSGTSVAGFGSISVGTCRSRGRRRSATTRRWRSASRCARSRGVRSRSRLPAEAGSGSPSAAGSGLQQD